MSSLSGPSSPILGPAPTTFGSGGVDALNDTYETSALSGSNSNGAMGGHGFIPIVAGRSPDASPVLRQSRSPKASSPIRRGYADRKKEYKNTILATKITIGVLAAIGVIVLVTALSSTDCAKWYGDNIVDKVFKPMYDGLGTAGCVILGGILVGIIARYTYRGINYLANGTYIAERRPDDFDPENFELVEGAHSKDVQYKENYDRTLKLERLKETWAQVTLATLALIAVVALPIIFTQIHVAKDLWNDQIWPALNDHVFALLRDHVGFTDASLILAGSVIVAGLAMSIYQTYRYLHNGKYLANVKIDQGDNQPRFHSHTWFAVSKSL